MISKHVKQNKEVFIIMIGTALAQGIALLFSPLLARLYSPSEYGLLGVMLAASNILAEVITLKYDRTIVLEEDKTSSMNILFFSLISIFFFAVLFTILAFFSIYFYKSEFGDYQILVKVLPVLMLFMGTIMVSNYWFQRVKNQNAIVFNKIVQMTCITGVSIYFGYAGIENGLILGYLIGWAAVFLFSLYQLKKTTVQLSQFDFVKMKSALKKFKNFPLYNLVPSLLYVTAIGMPFFMVAILYGEEPGGYFNMTKQLLLIPCGLVAMAFTQVYYRKFAEIYEMKKSLEPVLRTMLLPVMLFGFSVLGITYFFAEDIFTFLLGDNWKGAGEISSIYVFAVVAQFFSIVLMIILPVLGLVRNESIFKIIYFILISSLFLFPFKVMDDFILYYTILEFVLFSGLSVHCLLKLKSYNRSLLKN